MITAYIDYIGGQFEGFYESDGRTIRIVGQSANEVRNRLKRKHGIEKTVDIWPKESQSKEQISLTDFYNHDRMLKSAKEGARLVGQPMPKGNERQEHQVGDIVEATGTGSYNEGTIMIIEDVSRTNGYYRYYAHGVWHRTRDIR